MLTKMVNGETVICDAEEEVALRAFWAANDPTKAKPELSAAQRLVQQIKSDPAALAALKEELAK